MNINSSDNTVNSLHGLKILSMNVRGLRNIRKRRILFHTLKKEKYDIICFQETYLTNSDLQAIEKDWSFLVHLAEGSKNSKGLLTLFNKTIASSSVFLVSSKERCLISRVSLGDKNLNIYNVYAPCVNSEKAAFLNTLHNNVVNSCTNDFDKNILVGDFNTVLDNKLDIVSGDPHNCKIVEHFNNFINNLLLIDIWRNINPNRKDFTWSKANSFLARRIDFIFISENLLPFCKDPDLKHIGFSDHKASTLTIDFSSFKRGPSYYKFNVSLLKDLTFVQDITEEINRIKDIVDLDPHLRWEYIKFSIRDISMAYGRSQAHRRRLEKTFLCNKIAELEKHLIAFPSDKNSLKAYSDCKTKLELQLVHETEGARIRCGQKWAQEGEKCSKFFLNLEKQRSNSNTIFSLENESSPSGLTHDPKVILELIKTHFKNV